MDINQESLELHYQMHGKIEVISRKKIETRKDLSLLYTPGVAEPCRQIAKDYEKSFELTRRNSKKKVSQKKTKSALGKYCSKYALSERLVCGECGSPGIL